jgi:hypothetical protein
MMLAGPNVCVDLRSSFHLLECNSVIQPNGLDLSGFGPFHQLSFSYPSSGIRFSD